MLKTIYYFGNPDVQNDNVIFKLIPLLRKEFPKIEFIKKDPNEDLSFDSKYPIILDTAQGIEKAELITDLDSIQLTKSTTMHDFDLGFNLKLLKKLGKIKSVAIIAVPMSSRLGNISNIKKILKSLL